MVMPQQQKKNKKLLVLHVSHTRSNYVGESTTFDIHVYVNVLHEQFMIQFLQNKKQ